MYASTQKKKQKSSPKWMLFKTSIDAAGGETTWPNRYSGLFSDYRGSERLGGTHIA